MEKIFTKIPSDFWTTLQANALREAGAEAYLLALYLLTNQHANRLGVYYLPLEYVSVDTGLSTQAVNEALDVLLEMKFCYYDKASRYIWVCELAEYRIGKQLSLKDKQVKNIQGLYNNLPLSLPFLNAFYQRYGALFHLVAPGDIEQNRLKGVSTPHQDTQQETQTAGTLMALTQQVEPAAPPHPSDPPPSTPPLSETSATPVEDYAKFYPAPVHKQPLTSAMLKDAEKVLAFFNRKVGRVYRAADENVYLVANRLRSGVTVQQCKQVIAKKRREWLGTDMQKNLRPKTLFQPLNFEQYLGELVMPPDDNVWEGAQ